MRPHLRFALLLVLALLSGCRYVGPVQPGQNTTVFLGVRVTFDLKDRHAFLFCPPDRIGCSIPLGGVCVVQLDQAYFARADQRQRTLLVGHELGHCVDLYRLGLSHGGFTDQGKRWGVYWSVPGEGFAEAYGRAYLNRCGADLDSLGWMGAHGACLPPDPRNVTPELIQRLKL